MQIHFLKIGDMNQKNYLPHEVFTLNLPKIKFSSDSKSYNPNYFPFYQN